MIEKETQVKIPLPEQQTKQQQLTIQPRCGGRCDEKLRSIDVGSTICHGQQSRLGVLQLKVLILERLAVDGLSTRTISRCEIAT